LVHCPQHVGGGPTYVPLNYEMKMSTTPSAVEDPELDGRLYLLPTANAQVCPRGKWVFSGEQEQV